MAGNSIKVRLLPSVCVLLFLFLNSDHDLNPDIVSSCHHRAEILRGEGAKQANFAQDEKSSATDSAFAWLLPDQGGSAGLEYAEHGKKIVQLNYIVSTALYYHIDDPFECTSIDSDRHFEEVWTRSCPLQITIESYKL